MSLTTGAGIIDVAALLSRELPPDYTVVEVGIGSHPFPPLSTVLEDARGELNTAWSFTEGRSYTGIDQGMFDLELAQQRLQEHEERMRNRRPGENLKILQGDGTGPDIPVMSGSVDELLLPNILSSYEEVTGTLWRREQLLYCARVLLKSGGLLVVRENLAPHLYHPSTLVAELGQLGFRQATTVKATDPHFEALTDYYGPMRYDLGLSVSANRTINERYFGFALAP